MVENLRSLSVQIRHFLVQMLQLPVARRPPVHHVAVVLLDQHHIGHTVLVHLVELVVVDVGVQHIVAERRVAHLQQMTEMRARVNRVVVDAQLGRLDQPNVGHDVLLGDAPLAGKRVHVTYDLDVHDDVFDELLGIADGVERLTVVNVGGHLGNCRGEWKWANIYKMFKSINVGNFYA